MKVISAVAALAAIGATSALKLTLKADQQFDANTFMMVMAEQFQHPEGISHKALLELSDEDFQTKVLGEDHGFTDEHIATFKDYHKYNLKMTHTDRLEMHLGNFARLRDEEQALLQDTEVEESLLEDEEEEGEGGIFNWKRRRRRLNAHRRRRRKPDKKNGPNYSPDWSQTELWEFLDIMYKVKVGLNARTPSGALAGEGCTDTNQSCIPHSANGYQNCLCKFEDEESTPSGTAGVRKGDAVCLLRKGSSKCALGFRGSDATSDWLGYLGLFAWAGYNTHTFGNSQEWSIEIGQAFANEYFGMQGHISSLISHQAGGCTEMAFIGSSLGGAMAEITYENYKTQWTSSIITLDAPKVSSKDSECGDWDSCTGCRGGAKYYRAWYKNSLISAVPNKSMYLLLGGVVGGAAAAAAAVMLLFSGVVIKVLGVVTMAVAKLIVAYALIAFVAADNYHHVTSVDGSYKLDNYGNHSGSDCRGNPGWAGLGNVIPTAKYHAISYWMGGHGDNTWYTDNQPAYEDPSADVVYTMGMELYKPHESANGDGKYFEHKFGEKKMYGGEGPSDSALAPKHARTFG